MPCILDFAFLFQELGYVCVLKPRVSVPVYIGRTLSLTEALCVMYPYKARWVLAPDLLSLDTMIKVRARLRLVSLCNMESY